ncbi:hypothetical protein D3872_23380 [Massilia cavernae]|uniref:Uncharacterized protein n=1 Tax=Massilia cavernae TaxID=2320864 RepID=A0A418X7S9_9BURK|nr:hypothetical protein D3872_23380 [Massilia cavernae]
MAGKVLRETLPHRRGAAGIVRAHTQRGLSARRLRPAGMRPDQPSPHSLTLNKEETACSAMSARYRPLTRIPAASHCASWSPACRRFPATRSSTNAPGSRRIATICGSS